MDLAEVPRENAGPMQRWRAILFWTLVAELAAVVGFLALLNGGEHDRLTLVVMYLPRAPLLGATVAGTVLALLTGARGRILAMVHATVAVLVLVPVMGLTAKQEQPLARPVRLATWNVFFSTLGRAKVLEEIASMDADVIVLQAANDSLVVALRERFPERTIVQEHELSVVSRFPLRALPAPPPLPDGELAMFVGYVVETPHGPLNIVNMHPFSPRHALYEGEGVVENTADREEQVVRALAMARELGEPFVLAGDTNLPHLSRIARTRFAGLHDAFAEAGNGFGFTFPSDRPFLRIDRVLGSARIRFGSAVVGSHERYGSSDHRPLFVTFEAM